MLGWYGDEVGSSGPLQKSNNQVVPAAAMVTTLMVSVKGCAPCPAALVEITAARHRKSGLHSDLLIDTRTQTRSEARRFKETPAKKCFFREICCVRLT